MSATTSVSVSVSLKNGRGNRTMREHWKRAIIVTSVGTLLTIHELQAVLRHAVTMTFSNSCIWHITNSKNTSFNDTHNNSQWLDITTCLSSHHINHISRLTTNSTTQHAINTSSTNAIHHSSLGLQLIVFYCGLQVSLTWFPSCMV